eukprot:gb/GFBE01016352.1/.p1 GENE.gb/GFBE01016352.1/~~gb/GFBE01016352.1/.p1  ORF type:complete len:832 (+),score=114.44 gb/GFBE01016352.1/:1-2496(+)
MTGMPSNTDTDGIAISKTASPASASRPGSAKSQPGWIVQELPSVGWVVKELPAEDTGYDDGDPCGSTPSPQLPPLPPPPDTTGGASPHSPTAEPTMLPGVMEEDEEDRQGDSRPSKPVRPQSAIRTQDATVKGALNISSKSLDQDFAAAAKADTATPQSFLASIGGTSTASAPQRVPRIGGNGKPAGYDAFVIFAVDSDRNGRDNKGRAAAVTRGLQARGLSVCQQSFLASAVTNHLSSSDEAHFMAQAAQSSACAVVLLTRKFIQRVDSGVFGDSCVAAFTLAKRLPNAIVAAMEPDLVDPTNWGWNQLFARFSGRAVVDLSMEERGKSWEESVDRLSWLLNPSTDISRPLPGVTSSSGTPPSSWPASPTGPRPPEEFPCPRFSGAEENSGYHCFISHNWGKDSRGRDNHLRVLQIARALQRHGLQVFLEDWEAHNYNSADEAMVDGMRRSAVALVFVTKTYIDKIEDGKIDDDCVAQFNLAKRAPSIIPVVMEPELTKSTKWGWNRMFAHLSGKKAVDLSRGEVSGLPQLLWTASSQKMHSALDLLELRIRQEAYRLHPKSVQERPPPTVPHSDIALASVACFLVGAVLRTVVACGGVALSGKLSGWLLVVGVVSSFAWFVGFVMFIFWHVLKARSPPAFDVNFGLVQPASAVGNFVRAVSCLLFLFQYLILLVPIEGEFAWAGPIGAHCFLGGSLVCLVDAAVLSRGCSGSFQAPLLRSNSLPGWGAAALCGAAILISAGAQVAGDDVSGDSAETVAALELCGSLGLLVGAACYLLWLVLNPSAVRCYFEDLSMRPQQGSEAMSSLRQAAASSLGPPPAVRDGMLESA